MITASRRNLAATAAQNQRVGGSIPSRRTKALARPGFSPRIAHDCSSQRNDQRWDASEQNSVTWSRSQAAGAAGRDRAAVWGRPSLAVIEALKSCPFADW